MTDRVLVIQTAFLGDVVLTTPLLAALAARHGPVDVLTTPAATTLLAPLPAVRQVIPFDKHGRDRGWIGGMRIAGQLRRQEYARAYLPHRSWRSGAIALAARIPERIGFADGARYFYTESRPRPAGGHEVERLLALAGGSGSSSAPPVDLALTGADRAAAGAWLTQHGVGAEFIAVAPGSIWGTKRWPYYHALVAAMEGPVVVVGGPEDRGLGEEIAGAAPDRVHNAAGDLPLRVSAALIERSRLLVTNDSAPLHLATATGTPIVAIFGPTVPAFGFGPRGARDLVVEHPDLNCRPCSRHGPQRCPLGHHRCMRELTLETVLATIKAIG
ncbi:MAG TPA: lipopolysaccharide heptosyltransferase II [Gemmatimonadales bacterium]|nr:lipopolysaccharide heptosyltransferase II [Gemmatimonadales bacterium]